MFLDILVKFFFTIILFSSFEENTVGNRVFDTLPKSTYLFLHQFNKDVRNLQGYIVLHILGNQFGS